MYINYKMQNVAVQFRSLFLIFFVQFIIIFMISEYIDYLRSVGQSIFQNDHYVQSIKATWSTGL